MLENKIIVNHMELANRLVMPPMATEKSNHGAISDAQIDYYTARAGYVGLIILEHAYINQRGMASINQVNFSETADMEALKRLTDAVHAKGTTKICAQINHAGSKTKREISGYMPLNVNSVQKDRIEKIKQAFADAAVRAKEAGFDAVEVHGAHGYLLDQFYSPLTNFREDAYGGTLEKRCQFAVEVLQAVRKAVGPDFPMLFRFGAVDYQAGGSQKEDAGKAAKLFEAAGADLIDISGGMNGFMIRGNTTPGWFQDVSELIRQNVSVPVLVTGGIQTREQAEDILVNGKADLIGIGRPVLREPDYAKKILSE